MRCEVCGLYAEPNTADHIPEKGTPFRLISVGHLTYFTVKGDKNVPEH
jgi:hypothetical protein